MTTKLLREVKAYIADKVKEQMGKHDTMDEFFNAIELNYDIILDFFDKNYSSEEKEALVKPYITDDLISYIYDISNDYNVIMTLRDPSHYFLEVVRHLYLFNYDGAIQDGDWDTYENQEEGVLAVLLNSYEDPIDGNW